MWAENPAATCLKTWGCINTTTFLEVTCYSMNQRTQPLGLTLGACLYTQFSLITTAGNKKKNKQETSQTNPNNMTNRWDKFTHSEIAWGKMEDCEYPLYIKSLRKALLKASLIISILNRGKIKRFQDFSHAEEIRDIIWILVSFTFFSYLSAFC